MASEQPPSDPFRVRLNWPEQNKPEADKQQSPAAGDDEQADAPAQEPLAKSTKPSPPGRPRSADMGAGPPTEVAFVDEPNESERGSVIFTVASRLEGLRAALTTVSHRLDSMIQREEQFREFTTARLAEHAQQMALAASAGSHDLAEGMRNQDRAMNEFRSAVEASISDLRKVVVADVADLRDGLEASVRDLRNGLVPDLVELRGGVESDLLAFRSKVETELGELRSGLESKVNELVRVVQSDVAELGQNARTEIADLRGGVRSDLTDLRSGVRTDIAKVQSDVKSDVGEVLAGIESEMASLASRVDGTVTALVSAVDAITDRLDVMAKVVSAVGPTIEHAMEVTRQVGEDLSDLMQRQAVEIDVIRSSVVSAATHAEERDEELSAEVARLSEELKAIRRRMTVRARPTGAREVPDRSAAPVDQDAEEFEPAPQRTRPAPRRARRAD